MTRAILLGLLVAGVFSLHGYAAEPDGLNDPPIGGPHNL